VSDPILLDIPESLETERLILRCPRPGDGAVLFEAVNETLAGFRRFPASMPWALTDPTVERSEIYCRDARIRWLARSAFQMLMFTKDGNVCAGRVGLHNINWDIPKFEIGCWIRTSLQGEGLIREGMQGVTDFALHQLKAKRIEAITDEENHSAKRLCRLTGYALESTRKNDLVTPDGQLRHTCVYVITQQQIGLPSQ
jgi:RimJ/RimL family protein N-acetyltransferase